MRYNYLTGKAIDDYVTEHSSKPPQVIKDIALKTQCEQIMPEMMSGFVEGRLLKILVQMLNAKYCLDVGTFTGNSALNMAEGLPQDGKLISIDHDKRVIKYTEPFFKKSPHGHKIELMIGKADILIPSLPYVFDLIFIDADKVNYGIYYEQALAKLRPGGIIILDNMLYAGEVMHPASKQARSLHSLNQQLRTDERVEHVMLSIRDGMQLIRKK